VIAKPTIVVGAGAGIGVAQTVAFKQYLDPMYGNVPGIGDMLPDPWGKISVLGNILIGGIAFGISQFTTLVSRKNVDFNQFLKMYGLTTLIGGFANGAMYYSAYGASLPGGRNGFVTKTYYPNYKGTFVRRPASRAKGFASDVTVNPMAAIPTRVPYNVIDY